jgi:hypothetical protein
MYIRDIYILFLIFIGNRVTGEENSTRAHSSPPQKKSGLKLVCNVNIVHRAASMLYCTCIVLYPTYAEREGALSSVLHSCLPDAYKQRYKI